MESFLPGATTVLENPVMVGTVTVTACVVTNVVPSVLASVVVTV